MSLHTVSLRQDQFKILRIQNRRNSFRFYVLSESKQRPKTWIEIDPIPVPLQTYHISEPPQISLRYFDAINRASLSNWQYQLSQFLRCCTPCLQIMGLLGFAGNAPTLIINNRQYRALPVTKWQPSQQQPGTRTRCIKPLCQADVTSLNIPKPWIKGLDSPRGSHPDRSTVLSQT